MLLVLLMIFKTFILKIADTCCLKVISAIRSLFPFGCSYLHWHVSISVKTLFFLGNNKERIWGTACYPHKDNHVSPCTHHVPLLLKLPCEIVFSVISFLFFRSSVDGSEPTSGLGVTSRSEKRREWLVMRGRQTTPQNLAGGRRWGEMQSFLEFNQTV